MTKAFETTKIEDKHGKIPYEYLSDYSETTKEP